MNKKANVFALFLVLILAMAVLPLYVEAQKQIDTYAHLSVAPNPIGVGQRLSIVMWLDKPPPAPQTQTPTIRAIPYTKFYLTITKPNNETNIMGPFTSDSTGSYAMYYTPDQVGTYYFQFNYQGENITGRRMLGDPITTDYYKPSISQKVAIVVQESPIEPLPYVPLPTEYWTRPIDGQNKGWNTLAGAWLGIPLQFASGCSSNGAFNPYSTGPNTGHIMWTITQDFGGVVGGDFGDLTYYLGLSYQEKWNPPPVVVISGRLYYHKVAGPSSIIQGLSCIDIRTGQEIWFSNGTQISFGQLWDFETMNQHGVSAYLWHYTSGNSTVYDAFTGRALLRVQGCQSASRITMSPQGDLLVYVLNAAQSWMVLWNSSKALNPTNDISWSPSLTATYNWTNGIMWNVTIPRISGQTIVQIGDGIILTAAAFKDIPEPVRTVTAYDATTGSHLWSKNISDYTIRPQYNFSPIIDGKFAWFRQETMQWYGYDARTGALIWGPTEPYENSYGMYSASFRGAGPPNPQAAYGKVFSAGYDGRVHAIDIKTGKEVWTYYTGSAGFETLYGHWPFYGGATIADNKIFISTNEHTPNSPLWRGSKLHVINATTGEPVWTISAWMPGPIIAEGYLVGLNYYDGEIYCFGKGPSALTVEAPLTATTLGSRVVIRGTVIDISPGTQQYEFKARFPNGVPAVADECMSAWMEYVYMQKPRPADVKGVEVVISVLDPNSNCYEVARATSDADGFYSAIFTPPVPGEYTVIAEFKGSESYWPSHAKTALFVEEAPPASPLPTPTPQEPVGTYFTVSTVAIIIAIAIVAVLLLRKR